MKKLFLTLFILLFAFPTYAGQYEDALRTGSPVILYLHIPTCGYCKQFNPIYEKLTKTFKNKYRYVSIDAMSPYGTLLMHDFMAMYVPFVVLADAKRQYLISVPPSCLIKYECIEKEMKDFIK